MCVSQLNEQNFASRQDQRFILFPSDPTSFNQFCFIPVFKQLRMRYIDHLQSKPNQALYIFFRSLFANSVKDSIRRTAGEFMRMMPQFVRRLAQREYDFIMIKPVKRRILLKLYIMGEDLNLYCHIMLLMGIMFLFRLSVCKLEYEC